MTKFIGIWDIIETRKENILCIDMKEAADLIWADFEQ